MFDDSPSAIPVRLGWMGAAAIALAVAAIPLAALLAQPARGPFSIEESGRSYANLQQALDAIGNGRGTIVIAPGVYRQCAVQEGGIITLRAEQRGTVAFEEETCEGKAALVLRGRSANIDGIIFRGMAVEDGNGAGIRLEQGDLTISQSWFVDSQQGILTANDPDSAITIDKSTFSGLGTCENSAGCAHSIYTGDYGLLRVTRSRFERGTGGHYLKTRAARVEIEGNSFDDAQGRESNYMIDLAAGATGRIAGNWFVQGRDKENYSAFIAVGPEDNLHPSHGLTIVDNTARFVPGLSRSSAFVADWTGHRLVIERNEIAPGIAKYDRR
ncbi:right-handed parallel beta-helix repeat-containing protein [Altererythrobacter arenosus]|uniref:Right-handed parallel beta-helix repeat-containing protein n=1 Tax=Altererythrobacter arenosus TaxID=3032592 RepID=A0ABY8FTX2_9SPHN|nr:right-handed parallel beta-helix repeat-containing protein [Altererythrobacter sp. CAU 1644]WFL78463.1 right-handed parallel beta-helix repeat-containing protein [Altererythrobacter sp. CAU 1644]